MQLKEVLLLFSIMILLIPAVSSISNVQHSVDGNKVTLTYEGSAPFWINIRKDENIGQDEGYVWAKTNSKTFTIDLDFAINPSKKFYYAVKDTEWSNVQSFVLGDTTVEECSDGTLYDECSPSKPYYCDNNYIIKNCQKCGCPAGEECQDDGSCKEEIKPEVCDNGLDDDNDGFIDCKDEECNGKICNNQGWKCIENECLDTTVKENKKDLSYYSEKNAFIVSDKNWKDVLQLVPVTTWTGSEEECQKGTGTPDNVCVYSTLIYHEEENNNLYVDLTSPWEDNSIEIWCTKEGEAGGGYGEKEVSKSTNLEPGEIIIFKYKIYPGNINPYNPFKRVEVSQLPDFLEFVEPADGIIEVVDPNQGIFEFTLKVKDDAVVEWNTGFDVDSIIYFMQQYSPDELTVVGETPQELANLFVAEPELGAGLSQEQIGSITAKDYLSYWKSYKDVVYVEDDYELALLASTYSSLINAPLVIQETQLDLESTFSNKNIICVGSVNPIEAECNEQYNLEQLQQKYVDETSTDKIILVNPNDLYIKVSEIFQPEKGGNPIYEIYSKTSLAAPILASTKHEIILSTTSINYEEIDGFIENKINNLGINVEYLTIIASPKVIKMTKSPLEYWMYGPISGWEEVDNHIYGDLDSDFYQELAVGRILGITVSDVSSNIARSLFYNLLLKSDNFAMLWAPNFWDMIAEGKTIDELLSNAGFNEQSVYVRNLDGPENFDPKKDFKNKFYVNYLDHGSWYGGMYGYSIYNLNSEKIWLSPSLFFSEACSTCAYDKPDKKSDLFCTNIIRRGGITYIGTVENSGPNWNGPLIYLQELMKGKDLGTAFKDYKNRIIVEPIFSYDPYYILLGDPTFNFNLEFPESVEKSEMTIENIDNYNKIVEIILPRLESNIKFNFSVNPNWYEIGKCPKLYLGDPILRSIVGYSKFLNKANDEIISEYNNSFVSLSIELDNPGDLRVKEITKIERIIDNEILNYEYDPSDFTESKENYLQYAQNKIWIYVQLDLNKYKDSPLVYPEMEFIPKMKYRIYLKMEEP